MKKVSLLLIVALTLAGTSGAYAGEKKDHWSDADEQQLEQLLARKAAKVLPIHSGEPYLGYAGRKSGHQARPQGCTEVKEKRGDETFVWVNCLPGKNLPPPPQIAVPYNN